jgi:hypothetical protein
MNESRNDISVQVPLTITLFEQIMAAHKEKRL